MRSSVQFLNTLVFVTMGTACAPRPAHVAKQASFVAPPSNAYDVNAHAALAAGQDRELATEINETKRHLQGLAGFDFFWDINALVYPIYRTAWWPAELRPALRADLAKILALNERRRAYHDDADLQWEWQRAHETVGQFDALEARLQQLKNAQAKRDKRD